MSAIVPAGGQLATEEGTFLLASGGSLDVRCYGQVRTTPSARHRVSTTPDTKLDDTPIGATVKSLREAAGLSRRQLAAASGSGVDLIIKIENSKRRLTPEMARRIADALGLPLSSLSDKDAAISELERLYDSAPVAS